MSQEPKRRLQYCKKCGRFLQSSYKEHRVCDCCKSDMYPIPMEYLDEKTPENSFKGNSVEERHATEQRFIDEVVKQNPEFDPYWFEHKKEVRAEHAQRWREIESAGQYKPKCPTCGSPNVGKISVSSKVVGGTLFGLFSSNVRNTMRCRNCGYKW